MSTPVPPPNQITGARRISLTMLAARDQADQFKGVPRGTAKPLRFLAAFQEAEPYLGLPAHAFKLMAWLVKQTQNQDWEEGSRPIAWPSARRQAEFLGLSPTRVKHLNRTLFEAGIFVIRDNEQGKRYGRRDAQGRILEAYGFDLSPLALRYDEFVRIAAAAKVEREQMRSLRKRLTIARRSIRQAGEALAVLDAVPNAWPRLEAETADLLASARQVERSEDMALVVKAVERRKTDAEQWLRDASGPVETNPTGSENGPRNTTTNPSDYRILDTVIASEERSSTGSAVPKPDNGVPSPPLRDRLFPERLGLTPQQLLELAPRLEQYVLAGRDPGWDAIVTAADWLRGELGISKYLWRSACAAMGEVYAAVALALVSTRCAGHFTSSPGGYFAGMVKKFERGELFLAKTLWRLRDEKWGKRDGRRVMH
ncbi:MAG: replication protein C [Alphaproteobacteria bacterium]|nr:replication protein C [Alphaproteobacteria bacterium]